MENTRKRSGLILIAVILLITVIALGANTFAGGNKQTDETLRQYEKILRNLLPKAVNSADAFERLDTDEAGFIFRVRQSGSEAYAVQQTVQGYAGHIEVITAVNAEGTISGIHVGGSDFRETEGLGAKARDAAFTDQFRGQKLPVALGREIDAISGATITSRAVVDAVNQTGRRLAFIPGLSFAQAEPSPSGGSAAERTANASVIGYGGPVLVRLTLDGQNEIAAMEVGGARFEETEGIGSRVKDESFIESFIGLAPPLALNTDVDAIAGATISSQAVMDAVNEAAAFLMQDPAFSAGN